MPAHRVTWSGGLKFDAVASGGQTTVFDAPSPDGAPASAPTPMESVLLSLAACSGVDLVNILQRMRQPLTGLSVSVEAERADEHPRVYTAIRMVFAVSGEMDPRKVERAVKLSTTKYCSIGAMLAETAEISHAIEYL